MANFFWKSFPRFKDGKSHKKVLKCVIELNQYLKKPRKKLAIL